MTTVESPVARSAQPEPTIADQVPGLLAHVAGYVGHKTIAIGLRSGLVRALADAHDAVTAAELARTLGMDPFYLAVWCRAAVACGLCVPDAAPGGVTESVADPSAGRYRLARHLDTLLLDSQHPAYVGGVFTVLEQPEVFERFENSVRTGSRLWWDECSPDWISGVAGTGAPFYARLVPAGLDRIPGLASALEGGCRVVDIACGSGIGVERLARSYPHCEVVGVDGDERSLGLAEHRLAGAGLLGRCHLVHSALEELTLDAPATCVINNISMHECRDIDTVAANVRAVLEPGGWFVISDFPFPDTKDGLRSVPGQVMAGIQYFEAQLDDQLLPRSSYDTLLATQGFIDLGWFDLAPVHAVTYGRRPV